MSKRNNTLARQYKKRFWRRAVRQLPHHSLMQISVRLRASLVSELLSRKPEATLKQSNLKPYTVKRVKAYTEHTRKTKLWHGTGRFQHNNGEIVDTLNSILRGGSLNPAKDVYAIPIGGKEMVSISTTPLRTIARCYADTHGSGEREPNRYGSALWWVAYYYSLFYGEVFAKHGIRVLLNWSSWNKATTDQTGERQWGKKVHSQAISVWDVFGSGSDIPDNYPVLFGIVRHTEVAQLPKTLAKAEVRLTGAIKITDLSHMEVPESKVDEVALLLSEHGYSLPVYPIELGEFAAARHSFAELLGIMQKEQ